MATMATDEDTELRDLLMEILEKKGVLNKIKAELRANVFLALEEQDDFKKDETEQREQIRDYISGETGRVAVALIHDFLDHFNLKFTRNVLDVESSCEGLEKEKLCSTLGITSGTTDHPVLFQLIDILTEQTLNRSQRVGKQAPGELRDVTQGNVTSPDAADKSAVPGDRTYHVEFENTPSRETGKKDVASEPENNGSLEWAAEAGDTEKVQRSTKTESDDGKSAMQAGPSGSLSSLKSLPPLNGFVKQPQEPLGGNEHASLQSDGRDSKQDNGRGTGSSRSGSENNSIEEELDEDLTNIDDVLNSSLSLGDMTADHSLSHASNLESCDYAESFHQPRM
ncbi:centrosomal protein 43-like [Ornithodoros turicata]|uniref:centrosomal protein 43-like n=1 Tax=Ornithodoros turicata TaxID=34597 RepID=UPI003139374B